jgi:hypothetical protein
MTSSARLDVISAALERGETEALRDSAAHLEQVIDSPSVIPVSRIGDATDVPPPGVIRERINHLIHSLGGDLVGDAPEAVVVHAAVDSPRSVVGFRTTPHPEQGG